MDKREPKKGCVIVTVEMPRDLADLLAEHEGDLLALIELLGRECRNLPPSTEVQAEADRVNEQRQHELRVKFKNIGRLGYRLLRRRLTTDGYFNAFGSIQKRLPEYSQVEWRALVIKDIASELDIDPELAKISIRNFRQNLHARIKQRREIAITRLFLKGLSDREIADQIKVSITTVSRFIKDNREQLRFLFKELPETHKSLKTKKSEQLPGKSRRAKGKPSGISPFLHKGKSN